MNWSWIEPESEEQKIKHVSYTEDKNESYQYRLTWQWPREIKNVYVDTCVEGEEVPYHQIQLDVKNICTVAEYQRFQGYINKKTLHKGEQHVVRLYPVIITEDQHKRMIIQEDEENRMIIQSPKAKVQVIINEKKSLFKRTKDVQITVYSHEMDIRKEALCYMRKTSTKPLNNHDGIYCEFIDDIRKGTKATYNIDGIPKDEYINVFLTNESSYGDLLELIELVKEFK